MNRQYILDVAKNIKDEQREEIWAAYKLDAYDAIISSCEKSVECYPFIKDGKAKAIFGLSSLLLSNGVMCPWLITTKDSSPKDLLRITKPVLEIWNNKWPILINFIDARYEASLRWAKWAGFEIYPPVPYGEDNIPFCMIRMEKI